MFNHVNHGIQLVDISADTSKKGRFYTTPTGAKYPSVTTVLSTYNKEGLQKWIERVGVAEAEKIKTQAANRGTEVHTLAENYINNLENWKKGVMPFNVHSFLPIKGILDNRVDNIWFQEAPLYSDYLQVAGRVDCIAEFDGRLSIIDFKTSRKPKKAEWIKNYFMQEAFYAVAFEERSGKPIKQLVTIVTVDDDEPQVFIEDRDNHIHDFIKLRKEYRESFGI